MVILLNGWIFPTGGVASERVCPAACAACLLSNTSSSKAVFLSYRFESYAYEIYSSVLKLLVTAHELGKAHQKL